MVELQQPQGPSWMDAAAEIDELGRGAFIAGSRYAESRRFAFCRALCDVLTAPATASALVTSARTARQKRNRAFAAEFLAPATWLRRQFPDGQAGDEHIADCAHDLGVSTEVLRRQLENHCIAALTDHA